MPQRDDAAYYGHATHHHRDYDVGAQPQADDNTLIYPAQTEHRNTDTRWDRLSILSRPHLHD
jgi:hypothetical protein